MWVSRFDVLSVIDGKYKIKLYLIKNINVPYEILEYIAIDEKEFKDVMIKFDLLKEKWKEKASQSKEIQDDYNMYYAMVFMDGYTKIFKPFLRNMEKYRDYPQTREEANEHFERMQKVQNRIIYQNTGWFPEYKNIWGKY